MNETNVYAVAPLLPQLGCEIMSSSTLRALGRFLNISEVSVSRGVIVTACTSSLPWLACVVAAVLLSACGGGPEPTPTPNARELMPQDPTPQAADSQASSSPPASLQEYAAFCASAGADLAAAVSPNADGEVTATNGEVSQLLAEVIAGMEAIVPPNEVLAYHDESTAVMQSWKGFVDYRKADETYNPLILQSLTALIRSAQETERGIPAAVRGQLTSAGCIAAQPGLGDDPADRAALAALYAATDGTNWQFKHDWTSSEPLSEWYGVAVDSGPPSANLTLWGNLHQIRSDETYSGRVIDLNLPFNQLNGEIPSELGNLTNLTRLLLYENKLSGSIPSELGNLTNLTTLLLHDNQLSGSIPSELGNLTNLEYLYLDYNQLTGEIPSELGNLGGLRELALYENQLTGEIPSELGNLGNLTDLYIYDNQLTGEIPRELGNLANLSGMSLAYNRLSGEIPPELGNLSNLTELFLPSNQLTGEIPSQIGGLGNLIWLHLGHNRLSGEIPPELGNLSNLTLLSLDNNRLTGEIPLEVGNLSDLTELYLGGNGLTGEIPSGLGSLANLIELHLEVNELSGEIPPELGGLTELTVLNLSRNQLSGEIPAELGSLANLEVLSLSGNQLTGCIPAGLRAVPENDLPGLGLRFCDGLVPTPTSRLSSLQDPTPQAATSQTSASLQEYAAFCASAGADLAAAASPNADGEVTATNGEVSQLLAELLAGMEAIVPPAEVSAYHTESAFVIQNWKGAVDFRKAEDTYNPVVLLTIEPSIAFAMGAEASLLSDVREQLASAGCVADASDSASNPEDRAALEALYRSADGANWHFDHNWMGSAPIGQWWGVEVDGGTTLWGNLHTALPEKRGGGRVTELNLSQNGLSGEIPPELGNLTNLTRLNLYGNKLTGEIPTELGNLTNLGRLVLSENQLSGSIPPELGNLTNLHTLVLWGNRLSGDIPSELGNLTNLVWLYLSMNELTGCIPEAFREVREDDLSALGLPICGE